MLTERPAPAERRSGVPTAVTSAPASAKQRSGTRRVEGAPVVLSFGGARLDISGKIADLPVGAPSTLRVPLRCFADAGADVTAVGTPLRLSRPARACRSAFATS